MKSPLDIASNINVTTNPTGASVSYTYTGFGQNERMDDSNTWD